MKKPLKQNFLNANVTVGKDEIVIAVFCKKSRISKVRHDFPDIIISWANLKRPST